MARPNRFVFSVDNFDNQATHDDPAGEVVRMLRLVADRIEQEGMDRDDGVRHLIDINGNKVGYTKVS